MFHRKYLSALAVFAASLIAVSPVLAKPPAAGTVRNERANWTVADAIAYPDADEIEIVFTDKAFDRGEMASDGKIDTIDAMRHDGNTLTLNVAADGPTMCVDMSTHSADGTFSGSSCNSAYSPTIKIDARSVDHISGSMHYGEVDGEHIFLSFDLPIEGASSGGKVTRPGTPLPADGGAPGKAMLAHFNAVAAGDWGRLKAISHPERRSMMEASEKAGEHKEMFEFMQKFVPKQIKITGGMVNGDQAQVDYAAQEEGRAVKGSADLVQFAGQWYFMGNTSRD